MKIKVKVIILFAIVGTVAVIIPNTLFTTVIKDYSTIETTQHINNIIVALVMGITAYLIIWNESKKNNEKQEILERICKENEETGKQYKAIFDDSYSIKLIIDHQTGYIQDANKRACEFYGYSHEEITRMHISEINILPKEKIKIEMTNAKTLKKNRFNFKHKLASGDIRDVEVYSGPVEIDGKEYIYSIIHDVTESKKIEEALKKSREHYRKIFDEFPAMVWMADKEMKCNYFNKSWLKFTGETLENAIENQGDNSRIYRDDRITYEKALKRSKETMEEVRVDYRRKNSDGDYIWLSDCIIPFYDYDEEFSGFIGAAFNIHKERNYITTIRESKQRYKLLFENMVTGIAIQKMIYDSGGNPVDFYFQNVNYAFEKITGMKKDNVIDKKVSEVFPYMDKNWFEILEKVIKTGEAAEFENDSLKLDKRLKIFVYSTEPGTFISIIEDVTQLRKAETELSDNKAFYEKIFTENPMGMAILDGKKNIVRINNSFEKYTGYSENEIIRKNISEMYRHRPDEEEGGKNKIDENSITQEKEFLCKDGTLKWGRASLVKIENGKPEKLAFIEMVEDIHERKSVEKKLIYSERLYKQIFDESPMGIALVDKERKIRHMNRALGNFLGYSYEEPEKVKLENISSPKQYIENIENLERLWDGEIKSFTMEKQYICKNGTLRWGRLTDSIIKISDTERYFIGMVEDIDLQKKNKDRIRKLAAVMEQAPTPIVITDTDGSIEYVNPKFVELTGYRFEEVKGQTPGILKSGEHSNEFYKNLWETISSGKVWRGELVNKKKDGTRYWEKAIIAPILSEKGEIINYFAIKEDISEQKKMIYELETAKTEAEKANAAKGEFLANMSHELRTPLNGIIGFSELLKDAEMPSDEKEMAEIVFSSGLHLMDIVNNILDFSKLEANMMVPFSEEFDMKALLNEIFGLFEKQAQDKKINLLFEFSGKEGRIISDELKIRQIMINVIGNAVKFTDTGEVKTECMIRNGEMIIQVKDTGCGISEKKLARIYEPFEQEEYFMTKKYGGTGLGLTIVKNLVEILRGTIKIDSEKNNGTIVDISIPVMPANIKQKERNRVYEFKALLIDNEARVRKSISKIVENFSGELEIKELNMLDDFPVSDQEYDFVIIDKETAADKLETIIDNITGNTNYGTIIITAKELSEEEKRYLSFRGVDEFLTKPYEKKALIEIMRNHL